MAATKAAGVKAEKEPAPFWPSAASRYCTSHLKAGPIDQALRNPAPFWPSSASRYCTSDLKRGPIDTALRGAEVVVSAEGVRGDESSARAKKPVVELRTGITAGSQDEARNLAEMEPAAALAARQPGQRVAFNWRPLFHWSEAEIWEACGTSLAELRRRRALYKAGQPAEALNGWPAHPAYVFGNERLSCAFCVLGSQNDLLNGAQHNPELYGDLIRLEIKGGSTFKHGWSLTQLPVTGEAARAREQAMSTST
jgi:3'-phosphoadenosine 5'-phosphosulfate sulfotransferase (PAPS reductase)/FAD synthetase